MANNDLEFRVSQIENAVREHVKTTKEHVGVSKQITQNQLELTNVLKSVVGIINSLSKNMGKIAIVLLILIFRDEITSLIIYLFENVIRIWNSVSENWQIALFTVGVPLVAVYIDRTFIRK